MKEVALQLPAWLCRVLPYLALGIMSCLILCSGYFTKHGASGIIVWLVCAAVPLFLLAWWLLRHAESDDDGAASRVVAVIALTLTLFGEYGASSTSSFMFLISIWKIGFVVLCVAIVLRSPVDARRNLELIVRSKYSKPLLVLVGLILFTVLVQVVVLPTVSAKGTIRAITYYLTLIAALFCFVSLMCRRDVLGSIRTAIRCLLCVLVLFAIFELATGLHLPTSIVNGTDKNALATLKMVSETGVWIIATGPFYNPNNFCLFIAVLAFLALPVAGESRRSRICGYLVFFATLTLVATLGSTIISMALLLIFAIWQIFHPASWVVRIAEVAAAVVCVFFVSGWLHGLIVYTVENWGIYHFVSADKGILAETIANDFAVQLANFENGGGSMWMRVTMYGDLLTHIANHPLGVGPGSLQEFLVQHPSASRLVDPHNWWLEFALTYGWVCFAAYLVFCLAFVVWLAKAAWSHRGSMNSSIFAACLMACIGCVSPSACDFNTIVWLPVLLGFTILPLSSRQHGSQSADCEGQSGGIL